VGIPTATTIDETTTEETEDIEEIEAGEGGEGEQGEGGFALEQPYAVPSDSAFQGREFIIDPDDLVQIRKDLVFECAPLFNHLQAASIEMAWKRKGGMANGGVQGHGHKRSDTHAVAHGAKEFLLWVAADISREGPLTRTEIEAAVYHEMCHLGYNENTNEVKIVDEPVKYFPSEKRRYGLSDSLAEDDGEEDGEEGTLLDALAGMDDEGGEDEPAFDVPEDEGFEDTPADHPEQPRRGRRARTVAGDAAGIAG
jgi:hypothetical protein